MISDTFDANGTLGALSIGALVSTFLFGICTLQVYIYLINFPEDRWTYKSLVLYVWLLELGHCICVCHFVYTWTITAYGDPAVLVSRPPLSISTTILLGALIALPVQIFFADRVRIMSDGRFTTAVVCGIAAGVQVGLEVYLYIMAVRVSSLHAFEANYRSLIMTGISLNSAIDFLEALLLCYYLRKLQLQSLTRTSIKIHAIMKLTMETGLLKCISELSVLITFLNMPQNYIWLALYICLTRLHSNSLLASLNSRMLMRNAGGAAACEVEKPPTSWTTPSRIVWNMDASTSGTSSFGASSSTLVRSSQP